MFNTAKKLASIVFGNRTFAEPAAPYVGADSVLRLGPTDYREFASDLAGGGHIAGYATWQGAPSGISYMGQGVAFQGGGNMAGYGRQPGMLLDLNSLEQNTQTGAGS